MTGPGEGYRPPRDDPGDPDVIGMPNHEEGDPDVPGHGVEQDPDPQPAGEPAPADMDTGDDDGQNEALREAIIASVLDASRQGRMVSMEGKSLSAEDVDALNKTTASYGNRRNYDVHTAGGDTPSSRISEGTVLPSQLTPPASAKPERYTYGPSEALYVYNEDPDGPFVFVHQTSLGNPKEDGVVVRTSFALDNRLGNDLWDELNKSENINSPVFAHAIINGIQEDMTEDTDVAEKLRIRPASDTPNQADPPAADTDTTPATDPGNGDTGGSKPPDTPDTPPAAPGPPKQPVPEFKRNPATSEELRKAQEAAVELESKVIGTFIIPRTEAEVRLRQRDWKSAKNKEDVFQILHGPQLTREISQWTPETLEELEAVQQEASRVRAVLLRDPEQAQRPIVTFLEDSVISNRDFMLFDYKFARVKPGDISTPVLSDSQGRLVLEGGERTNLETRVTNIVEAGAAVGIDNLRSMPPDLLGMMRGMIKREAVELKKRNDMAIKALAPGDVDGKKKLEDGLRDLIDQTGYKRLRDQLKVSNLIKAKLAANGGEAAVLRSVADREKAGVVDFDDPDYAALTELDERATYLEQVLTKGRGRLTPEAMRLYAAQAVEVGNLLASTDGGRGTNLVQVGLSMQNAMEQDAGGGNNGKGRGKGGQRKGGGGGRGRGRS